MHCTYGLSHGDQAEISQFGDPKFILKDVFRFDIQMAKSALL